MDKEERLLRVRYRCKHLSCNMDCKEGEVELSEKKLSELKSFFRDDNLFKSPSGLCKIGFTQDFEIISINDLLSKVSDNKNEILSKHKDKLIRMIQKHRKEENQLKEEIKKMELELEKG